MTTDIDDALAATALLSSCARRTSTLCAVETPLSALGVPGCVGFPWGRRKLTFRFHADFAFPQLDGERARDAVRAAFATWEAADIADISFVEEVDSGTSVRPADILVETVALATPDAPIAVADFPLPHAMTTASLPLPLHFNVNQKTFTWSIDRQEEHTVQGGTREGTFDLESVALHMIGHLLGLGHLVHNEAYGSPQGTDDNTYTAVMASTLEADKMKRELREMDRDSLGRVYSGRRTHTVEYALMTTVIDRTTPDVSSSRENLSTVAADSGQRSAWLGCHVPAPRSGFPRGWARTSLTYAIQGAFPESALAHGTTVDTAMVALRTAFATWAREITLSEVDPSDVRVNLLVSFGAPDESISTSDGALHGVGYSDYPPPNGLYARSSPLPVTLSTHDVLWSAVSPTPAQSLPLPPIYDIITVLLHLIGHALGLTHTSHTLPAVMSTLTPSVSLHSLTPSDLTQLHTLYPSLTSVNAPKLNPAPPHLIKTPNKVHPTFTSTLHMRPFHCSTIPNPSLATLPVPLLRILAPTPWPNPGSLRYAFRSRLWPSGLASHTSSDDALAAVRSAFDTWKNTNVGLDFHEVTYVEGRPKNYEIEIDFRPANDPDSSMVGNTVAHADFPPPHSIITQWPPLPLHFDIEENVWGIVRQRGGGGYFDIETVALHEIGHTLGLLHSRETDSVMAPTVSRGQTKRALHLDDLIQLRALYVKNAEEWKNGLENVSHGKLGCYCTVL